jgi:hypothetical protein
LAIAGKHPEGTVTFFSGIIDLAIGGAKVSKIKHHYQTPKNSNY